MSQPAHVSVVLPTFNERDNIAPLIDGLLAQLCAIPTEIIVVDDNSPDGTARVVADHAAEHENVRLLCRHGVRGLTSAIEAGIRHSRGKVVVWMDCDLSMPPEVVPRLVAAVDEGCDIAFGSRYVAGGRDAGHAWTGRAFSRMINLCAWLCLGRHVHDYTSGFIAARRHVLDQLALRGDYGEYCIDLLASAQQLGLSLKEIPYVCVPRQRGESKTALNPWGYVRRGRKYVSTIVWLWWRRCAGSGPDHKEFPNAERSEPEPH